MIELTTGIAFLMSSIYGVEQPTTVPQSLQITSDQVSTQNIEASYIDSSAVEAYVKANYSNEPILVDIARCESTFRQFDKTGNIIRGKVNNQDVGVMQINERYHAEDSAKLGYNIYTLEGNVAFGKYLYDKYGSQPWVSSEPCWGSSDHLAVNK